MIRYLIAIALLAGTSAVPAFDPSDLADDSDGKNWLAYGRTYGEQRYSPLKQINDENIERLGLAWSVELPGETHLVSTPLVIDGVIYFAGSYSKVWAISHNVESAARHSGDEAPPASATRLQCVVLKDLGCCNDMATPDGHYIAYGYLTCNMRSRATSDHFVVSSSTSITLTGVPATRFSKLQQRCAKLMRYIVAHMQTTGDRK